MACFRRKRIVRSRLINILQIDNMMHDRDDIGFAYFRYVKKWNDLHIELKNSVFQRQLMKNNNCSPTIEELKNVSVISHLNSMIREEQSCENVHEFSSDRKKRGEIFYETTKHLTAKSKKDHPHIYAWLRNYFFRLSLCDLTRELQGSESINDYNRR